MKRFISVMLSMMMILTSSALSVFAIDETPAFQGDENAVEAIEEAEEAVDDQGAILTEDDNLLEEKGVTNGGLDLLKALKANDEPLAITWDRISGNRVTFSWTPVEGAKYDLYIDGDLKAVGLTTTEYEARNLEIQFHTARVVANIDGITKEATIGFEIHDSIDDVANLEAMSGFGSVSVYWEPVEGATKYIIAKSTDPNAKNFNADNPKNIEIAASKATKVKEPWSGQKKYNVLKYKDSNSGAMTYYKVYAVSAGGAVSESSPVSGDKRVQYIRYKFTLKVNKTLTSHNTSGGNKTHTFKAGTTLISDGFGGGKYKFYYNIGGKDYYFYCNAVDCKNASSIYDRTNNYNRTEAENYVNEHGFSSRTNYLIFASLYTQHIYIFKGSKGKWECFKDFECGSGAAYAASPSGTDKYLISGPGTEESPGKKASRHGRKWWSPFSSWNSFHSKLSSQGLGYPASKGCIRTTVDDAYYIYKFVPVRTACIVL